MGAVYPGTSLPDPYPERRSPEYCWRSWPPRHTDECGCRAVFRAVLSEAVGYKIGDRVYAPEDVQIIFRDTS